MIKKVILSVIGIASLCAYKSADKVIAGLSKVDTLNFVAPVYETLPLGDIKPRGWLLDQLKTMAKGSSGHLDETYSKVKNDNGWLGGQGDGWEETPYWLDGAVPLAYQLNDAALKAKVLKYINWTLDHQRPSGYFGPISKAERENKVQVSSDHPEYGEDWWPKMVMLKVLQQYYTATKDARVIPFMSKYFNYQLVAIKKTPLGNWTEWAESRGAENILVIQWLYTITKDTSLLELADILDKQSFAWSKWFGGRDWVINAATQQNDDKWMQRHGVNVGMALKAPALNYQRTHDTTYLVNARTGFNDLMTLHGLPMGIFSSDEDLHGNLPTQGAELCAIVESMFSLEEMIAITGDTHYADALERMTFNALPTQTSDDYNNKQYFQIANQTSIQRGVFDFSLPFERQMNSVLGARSGYTCCLANMHQGWTKYNQHLWYKTAKRGLAALVYGPNQLTTTINGRQVVIDEDTSYPFNDEITFTISTKEQTQFPLQLYIPQWCKAATVTVNGKDVINGKAGQIVTIDRKWNNNDKILLKLPMRVTTSNWGRNSRAVERGPLVYALKLTEKWVKGTDKEEGDYFSVYPKEKWNYGLLKEIIDAPEKYLQVKTAPLKSNFVWNLANVPVEIIAKGKEIPAWKENAGVASQPVTDRGGLYKGEVSNTVYNLTLVPYGFTKVRIVAFPVVK